MSSQGHKLYCCFLGYHYWRIGLEKEREQHWAERRRHFGAKAVRMEGGALGAVQLQQVAGGKVEGGSVTEAETGLRKTVGVVQA